jgi:hypothetical protein
MSRRQVFSFTIASGAATSDAVALGATAWKYVDVQVGTMSTAAAISIQSSLDGGSTFYNVFHPTIQSATVATPQVFIASGVGTNGGICQVPGAGLNHLRFVASAVVSGGVAIKVVCAE